jgi:hypothetical protein
MMFYNFPLTIPANTDKGDDVEIICPITYGIIKKFDILFPDGCAGFAKIRIHHNNTQILPTNDGEYFASNNEAITSNEEILITERPFELKFSGYNLDDTYDHTIYLRLYIDAHNNNLSLSNDLESLSEIVKFNL